MLYTTISNVLCFKNFNGVNFYAPVLGAAIRVLPVSVSVRLSVTYGLVTRKRKKRRKIKISTQVPHASSN